MGILITSWTDDVARYVKGIDNAAYTTLLNNEILETLKDFCISTDIWSVTLAAISTAPGVSSYPLAYPGVARSSTVWRIEQAWFKADGEAADQYVLLSPIVDWRADENDQYWRSESAEAPTQYHHLVESQKILVTPIPSIASTGGLLVKVSLIPRMDATKVDDFIFTRWKRGITYGVAAGLMRMANKPWTDIKMSEFYLGLYIAAKDDALATKQGGSNRRQLSPIGNAVTQMGVGSRGRASLI